MIVISGALVLVALVLLVVGLIGPSLGFVYASIAASLAAFAFLVVGILQRRKEEPALAGAPGSAAEIAAAIRTPETLPVSAGELAAAGGPSGDVLVVEGRPRYHVAGCRYLTGKNAKTVSAASARADGYSACGVCKPDEALASAATSVDAAEVPAPAEAAAPAVAADEGVTVTRATSRTATRPTKAAARPTKSAAKATRTATKVTKATKAPAKATKAAAKKAPAKATKTAAKATKAPAKATKAAAKKAPAKKAAKAPAKSTRSRG